MLAPIGPLKMSQKEEKRSHPLILNGGSQVAFVNTCFYSVWRF